MSKHYPHLTPSGWVVEPPAETRPTPEPWDKLLARAKKAFPGAPTAVAVGLLDEKSSVASFAGMGLEEIAARLARYPNVGKAVAAKGAQWIVGARAVLDVDLR